MSNVADERRSGVWSHVPRLWVPVAQWLRKLAIESRHGYRARLVAAASPTPCRFREIPPHASPPSSPTQNSEKMSWLSGLASSDKAAAWMDGLKQAVNTVEQAVSSVESKFDKVLDINQNSSSTSQQNSSSQDSISTGELACLPSDVVRVPDPPARKTSRPDSGPSSPRVSASSSGAFSSLRTISSSLSAGIQAVATGSTGTAPISGAGASSNKPPPSLNSDDFFSSLLGGFASSSSSTPSAAPPVESSAKSRTLAAFIPEVFDASVTNEMPTEESASSVESSRVTDGGGASVTLPTSTAGGPTEGSQAKSVETNPNSIPETETPVSLLAVNVDLGESLSEESSTSTVIIEDLIPNSDLHEGRTSLPIPGVRDSIADPASATTFDNDVKLPIRNVPSAGLAIWDVSDDTSSSPSHAKPEDPVSTPLPLTIKLQDPIENHEAPVLPVQDPAPAVTAPENEALDRASSAPAPFAPTPVSSSPPAPAPVPAAPTPSPDPASATPFDPAAIPAPASSLYPAPALPIPPLVDNPTLPDPTPLSPTSAALESQMVHFKQVVEQRERQLMTAMQENASLNETANVLRRQLEQLEEVRSQETVKVDTVVKEFTERLGAVDRQLTAAIKERDALRANATSSTSALQSSLAEASRLLEQKEAMVQGLLAEGEKLSKAEMKSLGIIKKLRAKEAETDKELKALTTKLESAATEIADLKEKLARLSEIERRQAGAPRSHYPYLRFALFAGSETSRSLTEVNEQQAKQLVKLENEVTAHREKQVELQVGCCLPSPNHLRFFTLFLQLLAHNPVLKATLDRAWLELADARKLQAEANSAAQSEALSKEIRANEALHEELAALKTEAEAVEVALRKEIFELRATLTQAEDEAGWKEGIGIRF
ncbi:hypothetical protein BDK51DRAFT_52204 [Blyttiomyces helicus]|uniref:TATA element modulatory factor 1 TATA binding domain-containing protein n=1 Tax=Blyttiomyces helicus TaxID=388810 RepID=A0A4P9WC22_9FUNG|nr:hypothetical protein BDK51DRAFT_52204 [Blyttiomyces helicus]|eukprot:RKO88420.1 hypothetical protein BDK51DRAFT_52204 [Blyttiomyces helicus]